MSTLLTMIAGTGIGALTMYVLDPLAGGRRRALARDKLIKIRRKAEEAAGVTGRDLKNRTRGLLAEGRAAIFAGAVDDTVLEQRIRSKLGFLVRHPSAIEIQVNGGRVTLSGPVLADEIQQLIRGVESVRGVRGVENRLDVHDSGDGVPALQGEAPKPTGQPLDLFQRRWSPSTRLLVGTAGILLLLGLNPLRKSVGALSALVALGLLAWGLTEEERDPDRAERHDYTAGWVG
jgi:BON domain